MADQDKDNSRGEESDRDGEGTKAKKPKSDNRKDDEGDDSDQDNDESGDAEEKDEKDDKPSIFENPWVRIGIVVAIVILLVGGLIWWLIERQYEDTDDAFIDTHIVHISPQIAGQVIAVRVNDNQRVRKGQMLVEIDSADADTRLAQVQAQQAQAETQIAQAMATERGAAAQAKNAERDLARYRLLQRTSPLAVAQQQIDQAVATDRNAAAQRDSARAQIAGARAQMKVDQAQIAAAQITLGYTKIVAPVDGTIAQRSVATGNYVAPGQELLAIVPLQIWVTANFKETQLAYLRIGQHVTIDVDSCDKTVRGHVDSIQRGAGQAFGILPPENATGNYVKVVQRVPVKILLDRVPRNCVLGPGMSVEPTVKVR